MNCSLLAALFISPMIAAPAPKNKEVVSYCATRVGDTLEYEQRDGATVTGGFTDVVTKMENKGTEIRVSITRNYPATVTSFSTFAISAEGVFRIISGDLDKRAVVLKLPAKVGTEWQDAGQTYKIAKEEEIETPAGKFKAIRIDSSTTGAPVMTQFWYALGIGLLKVSSPISDDQTILKSFKPGK